MSVGGWASAKVEASYQILQTHHRLAKVASLQEKHRCFRHFISIMKTTVYQNIKCSGWAVEQQCKKLWNSFVQVTIEMSWRKITYLRLSYWKTQKGFWMDLHIVIKEEDEYQPKVRSELVKRGKRPQVWFWFVLKAENWTRLANHSALHTLHWCKEFYQKIIEMDKIILSCKIDLILGVLKKCTFGLFLEIFLFNKGRRGKLWKKKL